jgi:hypothetical protein
MADGHSMEQRAAGRGTVGGSRDPARGASGRGERLSSRALKIRAALCAPRSTVPRSSEPTGIATAHERHIVFPRRYLDSVSGHRRFRPSLLCCSRKGE